MLRVAYDGTNYQGWQIQENGNTIEAELNKALTTLLQEEVIVVGASRTDSGVHALGNVAAFTTSSSIPADKLSYAVNRYLPEDIRVVESREVSLDFHPRYCRTKKTYEYRILNAKFPNPMKRAFTHFTYWDCDYERMQEAAKSFVGRHDFKAFCTVGSQVKTTVREITDIDVLRVDDEIIIRVTGTGFLYNMVRIIAGTLLEIGYGRKDVYCIPSIIESGNRKLAGPTAPAKGLTLIKYEFLDEEGMVTQSGR
ncbi:MAG: tRNA pseudouridine(38-40) synthase TruA [Lachnospiraceae bacterium]